MLRMRKFEIIDLWNSQGDKRGVYYEEVKSFLDLLNGDAISEEKFPPFRDAESLRLIQEVDNAELVDGEWYAMVTPYGKTCLSALCSGTQYGLTVIDNSRKGLYTRYMPVGENVWKLLAELSMDILIAVTEDDIGDSLWNIRVDNDYIFENYDYHGQSVEAYVHANKLVRVLYFENNRLHTDRFDDSMRYIWKHDIPGVLEYIEKNCNPPVKLYPDSGEITIFEIDELMQFSGKFNDEKLGDIDYFWMLEELQNMRETMTEAEYQQKLETLEQSEAYKHYLYYRDELKLVNHMAYKPRMGDCTKQPLLIVRRYEDGTYLISGGITVKYPDFSEVFTEVEVYVNSEGSTFILVVDDNEVVGRRENLSQAYLGFLVTKNKIEIFDKDEALWRFGEMLREAYESGKYTIEEGVY